MNNRVHRIVLALVLAAVAGTGAACGTTEKAGEKSSAPTTSATPEKKNLTIQDYIKENDITETAVTAADTSAPRVDMPVPPGWVGAGPKTPEWSLGAIIYATPADPNNPPNVIAVMSKLTGNVDPAKIVEYAPGEMKNQTGFTSTGEPRRLKIGGYDAAQSAGTYLKNSTKRAIIQTTVAIPTPGGVYALQLNADAPAGEQAVLADAATVIDEKTTITLR